MCNWQAPLRNSPIAGPGGTSGGVDHCPPRTDRWDDMLQPITIMVDRESHSGLWEMIGSWVSVTSRYGANHAEVEGDALGTAEKLLRDLVRSSNRQNARPA